MEHLLELNNVTKYYGSGSGVMTKALDNVDFVMENGEFTAIMGASGSGKSTLLNVIATIDKVSAGTIRINGENISGKKEKYLAAFRRDVLGFVFQDYNLLENLTIEENIALPLHLKKVPHQEIKHILQKLAEVLEMKGQLEKFPKELSGGQRQRAACARALITNPALILADEPTGALDSVNSKRLMETFVKMNEEMGASVLMVTHDALMGSYASRVLFLKDGKIWNELVRGERDRMSMYHEIMNVMAVLGGESDAC